jgi:hypothetical protein
MIRTRVCQKVLLAACALLLGLGGFASAVEYDPNLPRIEEVKDVDGSVWKVLITPRPLYRTKDACLPCPPTVMRPKAGPAAPPLPAPSVESYEKPEAAPADVEKKSDEQAALLLRETELISLQADEGKADAAAENTEQPAKEETAKEHPFGVEIVPRFTYPAMPAADACCPVEDATIPVNPLCYSWIYENIPFMRSEYIANPSYRHDATMEILLGQLRPVVAPRPEPQPRPHGTLFPYENDLIRPYSYYSMGAGAGYGRGPLPYGAPGAYGVNYNVYYPMPTVYRNY